MRSFCLFRSTSFFLHAGENQEDLLVKMEHNKKIRLTRMVSGKSETKVRGKKIDDPNLYPVSLVIHERGLKLHGILAAKKDKFDLLVNQKPFGQLKYHFVDRESQVVEETTTDAQQ